MKNPRILGLILTVTLSVASTRAEPACTEGETLYCCQAAVAGDTKLIQFAAAVAKYELNPNDVTCVLSEPIWTERSALEEDHCGLTMVIARSASEDCPGVYACCQKPLVRQKQ